jgi:hypothetical protein
MMPEYALWLDSTTTPPTATVAQIPDPLPGSNTLVGAYRTTQPTPTAHCVGYLESTCDGTSLSLLRWTPVL